MLCVCLFFPLVFFFSSLDSITILLFSTFPSCVIVIFMIFIQFSFSHFTLDYITIPVPMRCTREEVPLFYLFIFFCLLFFVCECVCVYVIKFLFSGQMLLLLLLLVSLLVFVDIIFPINNSIQPM